MGYCSQTDLEARISKVVLYQLCLDNPASADPDTDVAAVVAALVAKSDAELDGQLGQVYTVPFNPVPKQIKQLSIDLSCFYAFQRRFTTLGVTQDWRDIFKRALDRLQKIADLEETLEAQPPVISPEAEVVSNERQTDFYDTTKGISAF